MSLKSKTCPLATNQKIRIMGRASLSRLVGSSIRGRHACELSLRARGKGGQLTLRGGHWLYESVKFASAWPFAPLYHQTALWTAASLPACSALSDCLITAPCARILFHFELGRVAKEDPPSEIFAKEDPPSNSANSHYPAAKLGTEVTPSMNLLAQSSVA